MKIAEQREFDVRNYVEPGVCVHCQCGETPVRLRRRWVHHFPDTGQLVVCEEKNVELKPAS